MEIERIQVAKKDRQSDAKVWPIVLVALLDDIAALALVFIVLWIFKVKITVPLIIVIGLVFGTFIFIVHRAIIPSLRRRKMSGAEGMIGLTGEVTKELSPKGTIKVMGEYWQAKSVADEIDIGEDVEIVGINGLKLEVRRKGS